MDDRFDMQEPQLDNQERTALRQPAQESADLYPGLCVHDARVTGSITVGRSRLPLWAFVSMVIEDGWEAVVSEEDGWPYLEEKYGWTRQKMSDFLYYLVESRGEFGRLLLLMAEVERVKRENDGSPWLHQEDLRLQMREQLQRCLDIMQD